MVTVRLISLFVDVFGAFAYGSAVVLWMRQASPVWAPYRTYGRADEIRADLVSLALFTVCTIWFVLNGFGEFRALAGIGRDDWMELSALALVFAFPPLIMHSVCAETTSNAVDRLQAHVEGPEPPARMWRLALIGMYVLSPLVCLWVFAAIFGWVWQPRNLRFVISMLIGVLFVLASAYGTAMMLRRQRHDTPHEVRRLHAAMIGLYAVLAALFVVPAFLTGHELLLAIVDRIARASPLAFLVVSIYFENRFEFYDMVVKRGVMLVLTIVIMGLVFTFALPWMDRLPSGGARPWMAAAVLVPVAMMMPWIYWRLARWMDRIWFGRDYTPVEAVKHILAAMQPATDERSLIEATEIRLTEIFRTPIRVMLDHRAPIDAATVETEVLSSSPVSGTPVRMAVLRQEGTRPLLSEDLMLLRSLAGVFGFMLENIRLQHRRLEQEQLAQELRLQSSRSELKALRAQINPHFLFNALNAIASLIHTDPARADAAVEQLAEVFRYTLRRSDSEWAPLDQELQFAHAYLDVEQARFGRRLTFSIQADRAATGAQVPSMLLQTLVENAVKHGISRLRGPGHVQVGARVRDGRLVLEVRDTGPGLDCETTRAKRSDGESFGLRSVRDRLSGHFGDRATLTLERDDEAGVTVARIEMPLAEVRA
jgi:signal transduction histidine kinase